MQTTSMPVLATKLYIPPLRPRAIARPRLVERLNEGLHRKLTLISAPAGFGKTTLVSEWVVESVRPTAWLSLDEAESDPTRFLTYLVAALRTIEPTMGTGVLDSLQSPQPPPTASLLTALLNELTNLPTPSILVLDDYHLIDATLVDDAVTFFLDHLSSHLHLVISTREDPQLPLARLRARGQMTELRAADLRFSASEANEFLMEVMDISLTAVDIAALEDHTEGWIAGLQLAALSMRGRANVSEFIQTFAGDDRYIVDYLVDEVLQRQPEHVRSFLLQTSILERLSGPLCDAVTGRDDGRGVLEALERGNLFVVPLDDKRQWYRYHHLFADVLRAHAMEEQPDQVLVRHRRASAWYEQSGLRTEAIRHAFAAKDVTRMADLVELAVPAMQRSRQEATLLGWLKLLPDEVVRSRPVLSNTYAGALLSNGEVEGVESRLRDAERWLEGPTDAADSRESPFGGMVVVDEAGFRSLPSSIAVHRAGQALALGDLSATVTYAQRALELAVEDDHFYRGAAAAILGLAAWTSGNLEAAHGSYANGMASLQRAGYIADAVGGLSALADIRIAQGRLREAMWIYEQGLQRAIRQGHPGMRGTADMYVGMSELHLERNDLESATQQLVRSKEQGEHTGFPQHPYRWRVAMARVKQAQGDFDGALDLLDEAEHRYVSDFHPNVRPVVALKTRVWVAQGRLAEALGWVRERHLSFDDDLSYLREFEHVTLAKILITRYTQEPGDCSIREAMELLERLLNAAETGERMGSVIEILVVQALAHEAQGDITRGLEALGRSLALAEPEGYVRLFLDEGPPMARLLAEAHAAGLTLDYTGQLLAAFPGDVPTLKGAPVLTPSSTGQSLLESLSPRELEVLRLIAEGHSNREIGDQLYLALSTVKGHNRVIFGKLGVQRRTEAVARARELGLL